jgi:hypothetical protein
LATVWLGHPAPIAHRASLARARALAAAARRRGVRSELGAFLLVRDTLVGWIRWDEGELTENCRCTPLTTSSHRFFLRITPEIRVVFTPQSDEF